MVIATFGPSTGWAGKTITHNAGAFTLEGHGAITAGDVMRYDSQGHLEWAYDGLREWVQRTAGDDVATTALTIAAPATVVRRRLPIWAIVVLAVVGVFVVLAVIGALMPGAKPPSVGDPVTIGAGADRVKVTLLTPPQRVADEGDGWCRVRCKLRFDNVGTRLYHTTVYDWCVLDTESAGEVDGESPKGTLDTLLPDRIYIDPGASAQASVDFVVRAATGYKWLTYQGPAEKVGKWDLSKVGPAKPMPSGSPTVAASPSPSPQGLTPQETLYIAKVKKAHAAVKDGLAVIGEIAPKWPWSQDEQYFLITGLTEIYQAHSDFRKVAAPSARFAAFHARWQKMLNTYNRMALTFLWGAEHNDAGKVKKANALILKGAVQNYKSMKLLHKLEAQYR